MILHKLTTRWPSNIECDARATSREMKNNKKKASRQSFAFCHLNYVKFLVFFEACFGWLMDEGSRANVNLVNLRYVLNSIWNVPSQNSSPSHSRWKKRLDIPFYLRLTRLFVVCQRKVRAVHRNRRINIVSTVFAICWELYGARQVDPFIVHLFVFSTRTKRHRITA